MARNVSAIVLAAGSSSRMGRPKQLLPLGDKPSVRHCTDALLAAGISDVVVVLGACGKEVAEQLRGVPVTFTANDQPMSDMAESIRTGLRKLAPSSDVLVALVDHPLVLPETIKALLREHAAFPDFIIVPEYGGRRGHPSLFPRKMLDEIMIINCTLRDIVRKDISRVRTLPVPDKGVILDMDTMDDYKKSCEHYERKSGGYSRCPY